MGWVHTGFESSSDVCTSTWLQSPETQEKERKKKKQSKAKQNKEKRQYKNVSKGAHNNVYYPFAGEEQFFMNFVGCKDDTESKCMLVKSTKFWKGDKQFKIF